MKEQVISLETHELAKSHNIHLETCYCGGHPDCICTDKRATQSLFQKWLRDNHNIHIVMDYLPLSEVWDAEIVDYKENEILMEDVIDSSYESALEKALYQSIQWIINQPR